MMYFPGGGTLGLKFSHPLKLYGKIEKVVELEIVGE